MIIYKGSEPKHRIRIGIDAGSDRNSMTKCCNVDCNETATVYVFWPGQGKKQMCPKHTQSALAIANAIGMNLYVEPIPDE